MYSFDFLYWIYTCVRCLTFPANWRSFVKAFSDKGSSFETLDILFCISTILWQYNKLWYFYLFFSTQRLFSINNIHKNYQFWLADYSAVLWISFLKDNWTLKSSLSYLKEHLKNRINYLSVFDSLASFLRYFSFFDMQITHMT